MLNLILQISSMIVSVILIGLILLQVKGGGLGSLMGGDFSAGISRTRRGLDKTIFQITIGLAVVFVAISVLSFAFYS